MTELPPLQVYSFPLQKGVCWPEGNGVRWLWGAGVWLAGFYVTFTIERFSCNYTNILFLFDFIMIKHLCILMLYFMVP